MRYVKIILKMFIQTYYVCKQLYFKYFALNVRVYKQQIFFKLLIVALMLHVFIFMYSLGVVVDGCKK